MSVHHGRIDEGMTVGDHGAMPRLRQRNFIEFFEELNGYRPFPWQARLLDEIVAERSWPEVLDLPTASGKTATIDIAVFLMALSTDEEALRELAPRRLFFVVDRRTIVDEAYLRAKRVAAALTQALEEGGSSVVATVAMCLDRLAGKIPGRRSRPLVPSIMRGGMRFEPVWALIPTCAVRDS